MGNFSRNTFDPTKNYVGVRLEQGVPLVDADWNELNDVVRQDLYNGLSGGLGDGVARIFSESEFAFWIYGAGLTDDFYFLPGTAIVSGRPVSLPSAWQRYSTQPWADATKAAHDGTTVLPPLTTPTTARVDAVYLDVWEREVDHTEDSNIVNPVIGVETATRLKREAAVRVAEGAAMPSPPAGHTYLWLANLNRPANQATINFENVEEHRQRLIASPTQRRMTLQPAFQPIILSGWSPWQHVLGSWKTFAQKPASLATIGFIPVTLPTGALLSAVEFDGQTSGTAANFFVALVRSRLDAATGTGIIPGRALASASISDIGQYSRFLPVATQDTISSPATPNLHLVDNDQFVYYVYAWASGTALEVEIHSVSIFYQL